MGGVILLGSAVWTGRLDILRIVIDILGEEVGEWYDWFTGISLARVWASPAGPTTVGVRKFGPKARCSHLAFAVTAVRKGRLPPALFVCTKKLLSNDVRIASSNVYFGSFSVCIVSG